MCVEIFIWATRSAAAASNRQPAAHRRNILSRHQAPSAADAARTSL
jgi:hypothetical protein